MSNLGNKIKSLKSILGLNSSLESNLSELKKKRRINKRKKYAENFIAAKENKTKIDKIKVNTSKVNKKTNESFFDPNKKDIIKNIFKLKNAIKNRVKIVNLILKSIMIMMILNIKEKEI